MIVLGRKSKAISDSLKQRIYSRTNRDVDATGAHVKDASRSLTAAQWQEDVQFLVREMPKQFIYFDKFVDRQAFDIRIAELTNKIPRLTRDQIVLELMRIVALTNAGHTTLTPWQPAVDWPVLPLRFYLFEDGLYITHASRRNRRAIGSRVLKVGQVGIDRIIEDARPYIAADNEHDAKVRFCQWLAPFAKFYSLFGYSDSDDKTRFTLEDDEGRQFEMSVKAVSLGAPLGLLSLRHMYTYTGGVKPPVIISNQSNRYWFEFWEDSRTIYFQFSGVGNNPQGETIAEFAERLREFVDTHHFDRLIVDIRHNNGGDNTLVAPLVELLGRHERISQRGRLFTLIDRETFSAAVSFATALERRTKTLFVGEPTGGHPNTIGDNAPLVLPNSKIIVRLSWRYWQQSAPEDTRRSIFPDIPVVLTHRDYFSGRDPAIDAILSHQTEAVQEVELDEAQKERYAGRYFFNANQILRINKDGDRLKMTIEDYEEFAVSDLYSVSETHLLTDITGVELRVVEGKDAPTVIWKEVTVPLTRVATDFMVPVQILQAGRLDEAIAAFRKNKANGVKLDARLEFGIRGVAAKYELAGDSANANRVNALLEELMPLAAQKAQFD